MQGPISIAIPSVGIQRESGELVSSTIDNMVDETGRVVNDYIASEYINPLKEVIGTYTLIAAGMSFILIGIIIIGFSSDTVRVAVKTAKKVG